MRPGWVTGRSLKSAPRRARPGLAAMVCPAHRRILLNVRTELLSLLDNALNLGGRGLDFVDATPLMGAVPELDSMGVVSLLTAMEERLGFSVDDDEIDGAIFQTFGSLLDFVTRKLVA